MVGRKRNEGIARNYNGVFLSDGMILELWQIAKKEVIFCQFEFVGVRGYGRVQIGKKQVIPRKIRCFPWDFIHLGFLRQEQALALHSNIIINSLAVEQLFRRSEKLWYLMPQLLFCLT